MFKFEKLVIWVKAMDLAEKVNLTCKKFPPEEKYNLVSQTIRSIDSVSLNISEGSLCQSNKEQKRFLSYSIRSLAEFVTCLFKALNRGYISKKSFDHLYSDSELLMKQLFAFRNAIR